MRDDHVMRTTLDLDDDVLQAARELAEARRTTAGKIVSELVRRALTPVDPPRVKNGVPLLPRRAPGTTRPTMSMVNRLRDD
jgi:hypothetical protein